MLAVCRQEHSCLFLGWVSLAQSSRGVGTVVVVPVVLKALALDLGVQPGVAAVELAVAAPFELVFRD